MRFTAIVGVTQRGQVKTVAQGYLAALVQQDALLDLLAADGAHRDAVAAHLAHAVPAQEYHVLQAVQADRAHGLKTEVNMYNK